MKNDGDQMEGKLGVEQQASFRSSALHVETSNVLNPRQFLFVKGKETFSSTISSIFSWMSHIVSTQRDPH